MRDPREAERDTGGGRGGLLAGDSISDWIPGPWDHALS